MDTTIDRYAGNAVRAVPDAPTPLANIEMLANQAENIADQIDRFIGRCQPRSGEGVNPSPAIPPSTYSFQLDRLGRIINRLDILAAELDTIG